MFRVEPIPNQTQILALYVNVALEVENNISAFIYFILHFVSFFYKILEIK